MNRDKVTQLLKNYKSYKYAVKCYEVDYLPVPSIASYSDMPRSAGFESSVPRGNNSLSLNDHQDYHEYKTAVVAIEGAMNTLSDIERLVIKKKWMDGYTLRIIEDRHHLGIDYAKKIHRKALENLAICLTFTEVPKIHNTQQTVNA